MTKILFVRHGQAQFGHENYDKLSKIGLAQSVALGKELAKQGVVVDQWIQGDMVRHDETLSGIVEGMGISVPSVVKTDDLNEYDFRALLDARFVARPRPDGLHTDRKTHFRLLRDTLALWQDNKISNPPESWEEFETRLARVSKRVADLEGDTILVVSSGGVISKIIASALGLSNAKQVDVQLQIKNASVTTFIYSRRTETLFLNGFNETPFVEKDTQHFLTYS